MTNDVLIVNKTEHHAWRECPCAACNNERERHSIAPQNSLRSVPPIVAYRLGIINHLNPYGSLVKELKFRQEHES